MTVGYNLFFSFLKNLFLLKKWSFKPLSQTDTRSNIAFFWRRKKSEWEEDVESNEEVPDPRGRKSLPTTLSNTEDFPELWFPQTKNYYRKRKMIESEKVKKHKGDERKKTWPPTTATVGRASQSDIPSPP